MTYMNVNIYELNACYFMNKAKSYCFLFLGVIQNLNVLLLLRFILFVAKFQDKVQFLLAIYL